MTAVVEATHCQSDLSGRPLTPHTARDPNRRRVVATVVEAVSRIYEATRCCRARPDRRHAVVTVVEAARHAMVAGARLGGGRERGAAAALILIRWLVGWEEVAEHPLHCLHRLEREQPRATSHRHATSVASFHAVVRTREERENGREKTTREEKRILLLDHAWHSTRKARDPCHFWTLEIGRRRDMWIGLLFFSGRLSPSLFFIAVD
jgi:hypothetical protein